MENTTKSTFLILNSINVNDHIDKKNGLTYLSWAWAWQEVKKAFPDATYTIYENADGWNYFTDGRTAWVKTGVTIEGLEHIEYLPVMDFKNKSIPLELVTSFDVNKTIQRSLTKACARHGLGLYIYAGEDLPEEENNPNAVGVIASAMSQMKSAEKPHRKEFIQLCATMGVDAKSYAKEHGITKDTTDAEYETLCKVMQGEQNNGNI